MTREEKIRKGKFRIGVKQSPLYKRLLDELGDDFRSQIFRALSLNDNDMIAELKKFCAVQI